MSKKVPLYAVVIVVVIAAVMTFNASFLFFEEKYNTKLNDTLAGYSYFDKLLSVDEIVRKYYIGEIDDEELKASVIRGYLTGIGDKYSSYMTSDEYEAFTKELGGSAVGIGVNVTYNEDGTVEVISVLPDSPAEKSGIREGDLIVGIEGKSVSDIGYYQAIELIKGDVGTKVKLVIMRGDSQNEIECERQEVKTVSVTSHIFGGRGDVGVVRISEFNNSTPEQFKSAVEELKNSGCTKFVFDLRYNSGGSLDSIIEVLDYLLPEGPIAHVFYNTGEEEHYKSDASHLDAEVAVLTNGRTASAAELFTSALKDYNEKGMADAVIVGTVTYGKGVLQRYFGLKDDSVIKISVGKYNPPFSENYDGQGIVPDIEVELSEEASNLNFYKLTDENDNQLIEAVKALNK